MQVVRTSKTQWEQLAPAWNALAGGVPFRRHEWLHTWWQHYGRGEPLVLGVQNSDGEFVAFAPWYLERTARQGGVIRFLGSGEVCSDYLTLLCKPGCEAEVAAAIVDYLSQSQTELSWDLLHLDGVDDQDTITSELVQQFERHEHTVCRTPTHRCWRLPLPDSWEAFVELQSKSHRKQLRRFQTRTLETGRAEFHAADSPGTLARGWEVLVDLHQRRRASLGQPGCFASESFAAFHRQIADQMLAAGMLRLSWLELEGQPLAVEYQLAGPEITFAYQAGIDPDRLDEEPGRLVTMVTLQRAIAEGQQAMDFLRGDEPYKAHWRAEPKQMYDYRIVPARPAAKLRHSLWLAKDSLRGWLKQSVLPLDRPQR